MYQISEKLFFMNKSDQYKLCTHPLSDTLGAKPHL